MRAQIDSTCVSKYCPLIWHLNSSNINYYSLSSLRFTAHELFKALSLGQSETEWPMWLHSPRQCDRPPKVKYLQLSEFCLPHTCTWNEGTECSLSQLTTTHIPVSENSKKHSTGWNGEISCFIKPDFISSVHDSVLASKWSYCLHHSAWRCDWAC